jgi:hypothetical protein
MAMKLTLAVVIGTMTVLALAPAPRAAAQPQSLAITNSATDVTFDEADEYATLVWNDPWDMSQPLDVQQLDSGHAVYANYFNSYTPCVAGLWCGQVRSDAGNPELYLLNAGYSGALHVGRDGNLRPINAGQYTRLTFRMYLDSVPNGAVGWQLMWTKGTVADFCNSLCGQTVFFQLFPGWNIYSVDLTAPPLGGMPWSGNITGLRLDVGNANMQNRLVFLDWARLSGPNGDNRQVQWTASDASGNLEIGLMSSDGTSTPYRTFTVSGANAHPVVLSASSGGTFAFNGSLPPDDWRVDLTATSIGHSTTSTGRWRIQAVPTLSFVKPSYTSGDDYATVIKGDPWDMNNSADVGGGAVQTHGSTFANGIFSASSNTTNNTTCVPNNCNATWSDPQIWFLTNPLPAAYNIDTSRFRYLTVKLKVDGTPDISYGYIARVVWPYEACGISNDIPLQAGWNVVSLDLWDNSIIDDQAPAYCKSPWRASSPRTELRFDPHEVPIATTFYVDNVLLTAMDTASASGDFPIQYLLGKTNVSVTFYYNTTRSIAGRQRATGSGQVASPQGPFRIFLPLVSNQPSIPGGPPGTQTFLWHLAGVSPNTYYISADVSDGSKTTTWFSDTPVVVTP